LANSIMVSSIFVMSRPTASRFIFITVLNLRRK
jgi:hypothetical protein